MFTDNQDFYPTPSGLIVEMYYKLKDRGDIGFVLEPSAGKGDIAEYLVREGRKKVFCIEKDPDLSALLMGKNYKVIDSDFLTYSGYDSFDAIIMNPPFSSGASHLLKAISVMYSGQIVCLLNAETLKNPHTNERKHLVRRLNELNAEITYKKEAFKDADRKTLVDIAMVYIDMRKNLSKELFNGFTEENKEAEDIGESNSIVSAKPIEFMVADYNKTVESGMSVLRQYFKEFNYIGGFIHIVAADNNIRDGHITRGTINNAMNNSINDFLTTVRKHYWTKALELKEVKSRMTEKKRDEFYKAIQSQSGYDFTESNIRQFIQNLIGDYTNILSDAVTEIFDRMTRKYSWSEESDKNIHYYNGWKTNKAFYVNKKVIIPMQGAYSHPFMASFTGGWKLDYKTANELNDIDIVMNYFDGKPYTSISAALTQAFESGKTSGIQSTYFTITVYKKRTIHLTFRDEGIRRRFNIEACKHKKWLPPSYGIKAYGEMDIEEQEVVKEFEGVDSYQKNFGMVGFKANNVKLLEAA